MGYVYWTDIIRHTIMRANINGSGIKEIINTGVDRPGNFIEEIFPVFILTRGHCC